MAVTATQTALKQVPEISVVDGGERRTIRLEHTPFKIGRNREANDLIIGDQRVSREHAQIVAEGDQFVLIDSGSLHGTYVNGVKVERRALQPDDQVEFGALGGPHLIFSPIERSTVREFLTQVSRRPVPSGTPTSDLERLTLFLDAARKLNNAGVLDDVLVTLIDTALRLTGAERGFVLLRAPDSALRLTVGRNSSGRPLTDDTNVSRSIIDEAAKSASAYLIGDTSKDAAVAGRKSIVAFDLRPVICIPFRKLAVGATVADAGAEVSGVLYLDSRFATSDLSSVSRDLLNTIADEAATLVENARLVQAEEAARRTQQELTIAASIQQRLMAVIPELPFAHTQAKSLPCKDIGGDFYDVVPTKSGVAVVITDVCGKGITAALLASILQGMIYTHLKAAVPLASLAQTTNDFLIERALEKYATAFIAHLTRDGQLEFVNCGHVHPLLVSGQRVEQLEESNVPLGILPGSTYHRGQRKLEPGNRLILFTDGVTEAENDHGEFFGNERLEAAVTSSNPFDSIFTALGEFCAGVPLGDDCTVLELTYRG